MSSFLTPLAGRTSAPLSLVDAASGTVIAARVLPALDSAARRTGLLKHTSLPEGTAMIIAPTNAIHTWFMKFDIDVIFVARDGRVLKVRHAMRPWRMAAAIRSFAVVELAAGTLSRLGVAPGVTVALVSRETT
jgi:uncharacterized membrane protein (UPF0127 family)